MNENLLKELNLHIMNISKLVEKDMNMLLDTKEYEEIINYFDFNNEKELELNF